MVGAYAVGLQALEDELGIVQGAGAGEDFDGAVGEQLALGPLAMSAIGTEHDRGGHQAEAEFVGEREVSQRCLNTGMDPVCMRARVPIGARP